MKRKDIKAGVVYACDTRWARLAPVVFLEDGAATLFRREEGRPPRVAVPQTIRPCAGNGYGSPSYGYPALTCEPGDVASLDGLDVAAELALAKDGKASPSGLRITLVTSLAAVKGPWAQVIAEREAAREADRERERKREAETGIVRARLGAVTVGLVQLGITVRRTEAHDGGIVSLPLQDVERLLALLRDRQEA